MKRYVIVLIVFIGIVSEIYGQIDYLNLSDSSKTLVGASRIGDYSTYLNGKQVAIAGNQTSVIGNTHLVDTLVSLGVKISKIFCPEHGFRGEAEAGAKVNSSVDSKTGISIVSLYGNNKKPTPEQLSGVQIVLFDLQDVGVRFYTYISTLHYVMEACAENNIPLIVLDRPNPNGYFVDGPTLKPDCKSFVGMHPVPIAYGLTIGEYAQMINGEKWLKNGAQCKLTVVSALNYTHNTRYHLPIAPSPNLQTMRAIYLYPTLCLFEGTPISIGRGTNTPFEIVGNPKLEISDFSFTPHAIPGKSDNPPCKDQLCKGYDLGEFSEQYLRKSNGINIFWIIDLYKKYPDKKEFFTPFFDKLAGDKSLKEMIIAGKTEEQIRASWQLELKAFKVIRKKYLLYPDFD